MKTDTKKGKNNSTVAAIKLVQHSLFETDIKNSPKESEVKESQPKTVINPRPGQLIDVKNEIPEKKIDTNTIEIERIVVFYSNGTFKTYSELPKF